MGYKCRQQALPTFRPVRNRPDAVERAAENLFTHRNPKQRRTLKPEMPPSHSSKIAARHRRTRKDHSTETAEDYVEAVAEIHELRGSCRVVDLAERFAVSHVTVTRIISRLKKEGYVDTEPYKPVVLTEKGARLAAESLERHKLVYHFLLSIGVPERIAAIDTEGIEHHVSPETLERFRVLANEYRKKGNALSSGDDKHPALPLKRSSKGVKKQPKTSRPKSK